MSRVYHVRDAPSDAVYVGRAVPRRRLQASKWANPFKVGRDGTREEVIARYRAYLYESGLVDQVGELSGKNLSCWCAPEPCHADVLLELASARAARAEKPLTWADRQAQRIADAVADRLLAEQLNGDSSGSASGMNDRGLDRGSDQTTTLSKGRMLPDQMNVKDQARSRWR
jgi:hypothetical protein